MFALAHTGLRVIPNEEATTNTMEDEILKEFLTESWDNLARLDVEFVDLEKDPTNRELLSSIFRTVHTIKGSSSFINLNRLLKVAHATEEVLDCLRDGRMKLDTATTSIIFEAIDLIKHILAHIEATGEEPPGDDRILVNKLNLMAQFANDPIFSTRLNPSSDMDVSVKEIESQLAENDFPVTHQVPDLPELIDDPEDSATSLNSQVEPIPTLATSFSLTESSISRIIEQVPEPAENTQHKTIPDASIRVRIDVLDSLMNLVGELVLSRNQLLQMIRDEEESRYVAPIHHLNRITADLQEGVMKTRMQPIGNAWAKLPRLVRDLSLTVNKQIELEMIGSETELDRTVLDAIKDPLIHIVRNSADHGIESAENRRVAGKSPQGKIKLHAYHEGGHVIISIQDDGAGINKTRVKQKAIENGLISVSDAARLSDSDIHAYIFHPGLSTAKEVSSVSGRGVGMDVVKTAIEKIGGSVELQSIEGKGTTIRIKIPLTLAIISALIIESGDLCFAIPQLGIVELVRLPHEDAHKLEKISNHQVLRLRDRLLPIIYLSDALGLPRDAQDDSDINIVVVQIGEEQMGVIVSEVFDTEEIVVKPVGRLLRDLSLYQGTTILGDGRVIMILDVMGIASLYGHFAASSQMRETFEIAHHDDREKTTLLIFKLDGERLMAVPLALVSRLEERGSHKIEKCGNKDVIQYRNSLLPLVSPYGAVTHSDQSTQMIIVFSEGSRSMGLLVDEIIDIVEEPLDIHIQTNMPGVMGSTILNGKAIELLDTYYYITQAQPDWYSKVERPTRQKILVVDESLFFRKLLSTTLEAKNYNVHTVSSPQEALQKINHGEAYDLIISDLNFERASGLDILETVKRLSIPDKNRMLFLCDASQRERQQEVISRGAHVFATKFHSKSLLETVENICDLSSVVKRELVSC